MKSHVDLPAAVPGPVAKGGRALVDGAVAFLGVFTLLYQVALATGLRARPTFVVAVVVFAAGVGVWVVTASRRPGTGRLRERAVSWHGGRLGGPLVTGLAGLVTVLVVLLGLTGHRSAMVAILALGALAALVAAFLTRHSGGDARAPAGGTGSDGAEPKGVTAGGIEAPAPTRAASTGLWLVAAVGAFVSAALASVLARGDGDDAYFINVSAWVAERGYFPTRDTMISDDVFPVIAGHDPPVHSVEGLIGVLAGIVGVPAGTMAYVVLVPVLTMLAVLALARLVEVARVPAGAWGLVAALLFLWCNGRSGASFGNFFALRIWQGKTMLLAIVIPVIIALAIEVVDSGGRRRQLMLGLAVVAAIGASNTAVFLVPVLLGGIVVGAFVRGGWRPALAVAPWVAYPLAVGAVVVATSRRAAAQGGGASLGDAPVTDPLDPLTAVPGTAGAFVTFALAIGLGWLGLRRREAQHVALGLVLACSFSLVPAVSDVLARLGIESILWRMWWIVPVPLLLAGVVGLAAQAIHGVLTRRRRARPDGQAAWRRAVNGAAGLVAVGLGPLPLVGGVWLGHPDNGARWASPTEWKVPERAVAGAARVAEVAEPGETVLVSWPVDRVLAGLSVDVKPVSARTAYLNTYRGAPAAQVPERQELQRFADEEWMSAQEIRPELDELGIRTVCLRASREGSIRTLEELGFQPVPGNDDYLTCVQR